MTQIRQSTPFGYNVNRTMKSQQIVSKRITNYSFDVPLIERRHHVHLRFRSFKLSTSKPTSPNMSSHDLPSVALAVRSGRGLTIVIRYAHYIVIFPLFIRSFGIPDYYVIDRFRCIRVSFSFLRFNISCAPRREIKINIMFTAFNFYAQALTVCDTALLP